MLSTPIGFCKHWLSPHVLDQLTDITLRQISSVFSSHWGFAYLVDQQHDIFIVQIFDVAIMCLLMCWINWLTYNRTDLQCSLLIGVLIIWPNQLPDIIVGQIFSALFSLVPTYLMNKFPDITLRQIFGDWHDWLTSSLASSSVFSFGAYLSDGSNTWHYSWTDLECWILIELYLYVGLTPWNDIILGRFILVHFNQ